MSSSRLTERLADIRAHVKGALGEFPVLEQTASRSGSVDLGPLEDSLRRAVREVGRLRNTGDDPRFAQEEWWECVDCRAKLAAVCALTITIVRKDLTVRISRQDSGEIVVGCPRCKMEQQFDR
jgi:hypothetical protein